MTVARFKIKAAKRAPLYPSTTCLRAAKGSSDVTGQYYSKDSHTKILPLAYTLCIHNLFNIIYELHTGRCFRPGSTKVSISSRTYQHTSLAHQSFIIAYDLRAILTLLEWNTVSVFLFVSLCTGIPWGSMVHSQILSKSDSWEIPGRACQFKAVWFKKSLFSSWYLLSKKHSTARLILTDQNRE